MPAAVNLRGMTWSSPRGYDPLVAASEAFQASNPQVNISWEQRSLQEFESTSIDSLAQTFDLMVIDHPHVGAVVQDGCLLPLDEHIETPLLAALQGETVGKSFESYHYQGHQWALPIDAACQVQAIRPDLCQAPPKSSGEVLRLASERRVFWPLRPPHVLMTYFTLMANLGEPFPVARGERQNRGAATKALEFMIALAGKIDPACQHADPIDALEALADSSRLMCIPFTYLYAPYSKEGFRKNLITFHDMPALGASGPLGSALGGTGIAVSAKTSHPRLCSDFAAWVASAKVQSGIYTSNNGQPGNARAWANRKVNAAVSNAYCNTRMTHEAAWLRPRHAGYMAFQEEASDILLDALFGNSQITTVLDKLQTRIDESHAT